MSEEYEDWVDGEGWSEESTPDPKVLQAARDLCGFFARRRMPFYVTQLEWMFEKTYYHWITYRAIESLVPGFFTDYRVKTAVGEWVRFVARKGVPEETVNRHIRRVVKLLNRLWDPELSKIRGKHLAALVRAELRANNVAIVGTDANSYGGRTWTATGHDLDFVAEYKDGSVIGIEVKNTIAYIPREEFKVKLAMCQYLGMRWTPLLRQGWGQNKRDSRCVLGPAHLWQ